MNLKVLRLCKWMTISTVRTILVNNHSQHYKKSLPILHRNGLYKYGDFTWFEIDGECWFITDPHYFDETFKKFHLAEMTKEEVKGLTQICKTKFKTKEQQELLNDYRIIKEIQYQTRQNNLQYIRGRMKLKNFKAN